MKRTIAIVAGLAMLIVGTSATSVVAADLIRSKDIKDGTIRAKDIRPSLVNKINKKGAQGPKGDTGPQGPAGPAGASGIVRVTNLDGAWKARATDTAGLHMTGDGIKFGPFANGGGCSTPGVEFARLDWSGLNGTTLASLKSLVVHARYTSTGDTSGVGAPTVRVYFEGQDGDGTPNRLTFSANTQPDGDFAEGPMHEWIVTSGTVRYNDDAGNNPAEEKARSTWVAQFPNAKITNINILNGCQAGQDLTSLVRRVEANGTTYAFGS